MNKKGILTNRRFHDILLMLAQNYFFPSNSRKMWIRTSSFDLIGIIFWDVSTFFC